MENITILKIICSEGLNIDIGSGACFEVSPDQEELTHYSLWDVVVILEV